jgi:uncharacterized protein (TIGR03083 family)
MATDYQTLMWAEVDDIGGLLHELSPDEFDTPSLCDGWRVRDVIGHMSYGHTTSMPTILAGLLKYRFNPTKGSFELSKEFGSSHTPEELVEFWDTEMIAKHSRKGIAKTIKYTEAYLDHFIHNQDMRRPLERSREIEAERLTAAMDLLPGIKTPLFATKGKAEGLQLHATDIDHTVGTGPVVEGSAEASVMAIAGRAVALDELSGDGLSRLVERVKK